MASLTALLFGVTIAMAIGPIALLIVNASVSASFGIGIRSAFGAAAGDFTYALVAFLAGSFATRTIAGHRQILTVVASLVLVALGIWLAACALMETGEIRHTLPEAFLKRPLQTTYVLTLINPLTIVAFAGLASLFKLAGAPVLAVWYAFCAFLGSLGVQLALALGGAGLGRLLRNQRHLRFINFVSGAGIAAFGMVGLLREFLWRF